MIRSQVTVMPRCSKGMFLIDRRALWKCSTGNGAPIGPRSLRRYSSYRRKYLPQTDSVSFGVMHGSRPSAYRCFRNRRTVARSSAARVFVVCSKPLRIRRRTNASPSGMIIVSRIPLSPRESALPSSQVKHGSLTTQTRLPQFPPKSGKTLVRPAPELGWEAKYDGSMAIPRCSRDIERD